MDRNLGPTGIEGLGDLPFGTHFCLFYETKQDLLETLSGYFKAGLENHEFCLWITSESSIEEARNVLRWSVPGADQYLEAGDIEILTYRQWYFTADAFVGPQAIENLNARLSQALANGYSRMRAAGDVAWLDQADWHAFSDYERELDKQNANKNLLVVCAYPMGGHSASDVLDIARTHEYVAAKRHGNWEVLESPGLKRTKMEFQNFIEEPKQQIKGVTKSGPSWPPIRPAMLSYSVAILSVIIATIILTQMEDNLGAAAHGSLYLCAVLLSAWFGGVGPGLLSLAFSGLAFDYFFLPPVNSLAIEAAQLPRLVVFVLASLFIVAISAAQRRAVESLRHLRDGLKRNIQALQAEIVERKQAEKALRESETKLKEAQLLAHIGYWDHDLVADRITGSEGAYRIFGLQPEESVLNQAKLLEMIHPDDRQIQQRAFRDALQGSRIYDVEYRIFRPDGDIRFVHVRDEIEYDQSGQPIRMFGAVQDITERKQAEEAAIRQAARAQLLADISRATAEAGLDYQRVLDTITRRTAELIGDGCMILQLSEDRQRLRPAAFHHPNPQAFAMMQEILTNAPPGSLDTAISERLLAGEAVWMPAVTNEEIRPLLSPQYQPYIVQIGISSLLAVPLRVQDHVIGILSLSRDRPGQPYTHLEQILLQDIADRAALTIENARLFQSVSEKRERLRALSARLMDVQETERSNIARELHDEIGQILSGLIMQLGIARSQLPKSAKSVQNILEGAEDLIQVILGRTREIITGLRPQVLDDLGLVPALRRLASEFQKENGIQVEIKTYQIPDRLFAPLELALFRIVQEGLTNVRKHAQAHAVSIALVKEDEQVALSIRDDGRGFENQPDARPHLGRDRILEGGWSISEGHFGLIGIQERVAQLGGRMKITSRPGQGTTLRVELPLIEPEVVSNEPL